MRYTTLIETSVLAANLSDPSLAIVDCRFDLNDTGVSLLTYEPVTVGSRYLVTIRGGGASVRCLAEVRRCEELDARLRAGAQGVRAYRCGLAFLEPARAQVDILNQLCWHYAVPAHYAEFDRNRREPGCRCSAGSLKDQDQEHKMILLLEYLCRSGMTLFTVSVGAGRG